MKRSAMRLNPEAVDAPIECITFVKFIAEKEYGADWLLDKLLVRFPEMKVVMERKRI